VTPVTPAISGAMIRDLVLCERKAALDIHGDPVLRDPVSAFTRMLWREGLAHETKVLSGFGEGLADLRGLTRSERESGTLSTIEARLPVILGAVIRHNNMIGMPDVLRWTPLGYVASDVKSGAALEGAERNYKQGYLVQVAHYAHILGASCLERTDGAGIVDRTGSETLHDLSLPSGRERISGTDLRLRLLDRARQVRANADVTRGALSAICSMCEWKTFCRKELTAADDLKRIAGLGRAVRASIEKLGDSVGALANLYTTLLDPLPGVGADRLQPFVERARFIADPCAGPVVRAPLALTRPAHAIDFDVEADPIRGLVYLHGFWHVIEGKECFVHFFAETADEARERRAFPEAIDHFRQYRDAHWFHYSAYERTAYRGLQRRHPEVCGEDEIDIVFAPERCTDIYAIIAKRTDWPLSSYGIKSIAKACGFGWEDVVPGGANSIEWYDQFVETGDNEVRNRIVAYNRDDVIASHIVRDALAELETTGVIAAFRRPAI